MGELYDFDPTDAQQSLPKNMSSLQLRDVEADEIDLDSALSKHFASVYFVDRKDDYNDIYSPKDWDKIMQKIDQYM